MPARARYLHGSAGAAEPGRPRCNRGEVRKGGVPPFEEVGAGVVTGASE